MARDDSVDFSIFLFEYFHADVWATIKLAGQTIIKFIGINLAAFQHAYFACDGDWAR